MVDEEKSVCGGDRCQNRGRQQRDVSAVGAVSKVGRGRRKGRRGEGCIVVKANGRQRLCHTLSLIWHLPISPPHQSIARNTRPRTNKILFSFFLPCFAGNVPGKQSTKTCTVRSVESTIYDLEAARMRVEGRECDGGLCRNKSPGVRMRNLCGPCALRIPKAKPRKGDGRRV